jgi:hypothetical protein
MFLLSTLTTGPNLPICSFNATLAPYILNLLCSNYSVRVMPNYAKFPEASSTDCENSIAAGRQVEDAPAPATRGAIAGSIESRVGLQRAKAVTFSIDTEISSNASSTG